MTPFDTLSPRIMRDLMRDFPIDKLDAAAVCGNIGRETNGLTVMQEVKPTVPGSRGGYGWPQWTGPAIARWAPSARGILRATASLRRRGPARWLSLATTSGSSSPSSAAA